MINMEKARSKQNEQRKVELKELSKELMVPYEAFKRYGCLYCEWRTRDDRCKHYHDDKYMIKICDERIDWLCDLTPEYDKMPTINQWNRDFSIALNISVIPQYKQAEAFAQKSLEKLDNTNPEHIPIIQRLHKELEMYHSFWTNLNKQITHYEDQQVNRDTPKKLEVTQTHKMSITDIHREIAEYRKRKGHMIDVTPKQDDN